MPGTVWTELLSAVSLLVTCLLAKWEMPYFQLLSVLILGEVPSHRSLSDSSEYPKQMKSLNSFRYFLNAPFILEKSFLRRQKSVPFGATT